MRCGPIRSWWLLLVAVAIAASEACGVREAELHCEEAVQHLAACCPDFRPALVTCDRCPACENRASPAIGLEDSRCIRSLDCETVRQRLLCERVTELARLAGALGLVTVCQ